MDVENKCKGYGGGINERTVYWLCVYILYRKPLYILDCSCQLQNAKNQCTQTMSNNISL
jgi:hypothetical protein